VHEKVFPFLPTVEAVRTSDWRSGIDRVTCKIGHFAFLKGKPLLATSTSIDLHIFNTDNIHVFALSSVNLNASTRHG
jgi:hypothetical protein